MNSQNVKKQLDVFAIIKLFPIIFFLIFLVLIPFFPEYFTWLKYPNLFLLITGAMLAINILIFYFTEKKKMKWLWVYSGYIFVLYNAFIIFSTGGINGSFMYILVFVPLISSSYLDLKISRNIGIFSVLVLASLLFFDKTVFFDKVLLTKFIIHLFTYALITYLMYRVVKEVILQKNEKEQFMKKFVDLSELDKVKQMFISSISHQLRTPLNGARWALDTFISDNKCEDTKILIDGRQKVVEAVNIVSEILKTTELNIGKTNDYRFYKDKVSLFEVVKSIVIHLEYLVQGKSVVVKIGEGDDVKVRGDRKMLDLAITNVIDNAIRYSPRGNVNISIEKINDEAVLTVKDSGIGIDPSDMGYMFNKFFRGKNAIEVDPNESGIGLYSTKKVIELHGGDIKLNSILGKGTTVKIILPID